MKIIENRENHVKTVNKNPRGCHTINAQPIRCERERERKQWNNRKAKGPKSRTDKKSDNTVNVNLNGKNELKTELIPVNESKIIKLKMSEQVLLIKKPNGDKNLEKVSLFVIKKAIDGAAGSEVESARKTRDGKIIVVTKNSKQAKNLQKMTMKCP